jgi:hypothetical protein
MDSIDDLPMNENNVSPGEATVLQNYFKGQGGKKSSRCLAEFKEIVLATLLFTLLSNNYVDKIIDQLPNSENIFVRYGVKALLFFCLLYILVIFFS